jgi:hypothetical protein
MYWSTICFGVGGGADPEGGMVGGTGALGPGSGTGAAGLVGFGCRIVPQPASSIAHNADAAPARRVMDIAIPGA